MIKLELKPEVLALIAKILQNVYQEFLVTKDIQQKIVRSIGFDLADKFQSKAKKQIKADLFDMNKQIKVSVKTHEAWALQKILNESLIYESSHRDQLRLQTIINTLDQKLI